MLTEGYSLARLTHRTDTISEERAAETRRGQRREGHVKEYHPLPLVPGEVGKFTSSHIP